MRIYQRANGNHPERDAVKFPYQNNAPARYRVFPVYRYRFEGRRKNTLQEEVAFNEIEHAAEFLVRHPGSAIRVMPGRAIVFNDLIIDVQAEEPGPTAEIPEETDEEEEQ